VISYHPDFVITALSTWVLDLRPFSGPLSLVSAHDICFVNSGQAVMLQSALELCPHGFAIILLALGAQWSYDEDSWHPQCFSNSSKEVL
jgi:hypothetical protein